MSKIQSAYPLPADSLQPDVALSAQPIPARHHLRELAAHDRPQERLERLGPTSLSDAELLAMVIRSGSKDFDVLSLATEIIRDAGSLAGLLSWSLENFCEKKGIGKVKALQLITIMEISKRVLRQNRDAQAVLDSAEKIYEFALPYTAGLNVEKLWALSLNTKNRLIRFTEITSGIANASLVHPREVFREAIKYNATALVVLHNHPSGDPAPSQQDIQATRSLRKAGEVLGIELLDHIIAGTKVNDPRGEGYYSFHEAGLL